MEFWILTALAVYLLGIYFGSALLIMKIGPVAYAGSRDAQPQDSTLRARALRASRNYQENLPVFLALAILALIVDTVNMPQALLGAQIFVIARIIYIPVYLAAVPFLRSVVFMVGLVGLGLMALAIV